MAYITATLNEGLRATISNARHTWYADEPVQEGGTDAGPTPYEQLLGSLAACTALTVRLYANHKGIPLEWVEAAYEFDRVHTHDCELCEKEDDGMIERVQSRITLGGVFDEGQRKRLEQIVGRCPVHKTLANGMRIFDTVNFVDTATPAAAGDMAAGDL